MKRFIICVLLVIVLSPSVNSWAQKVPKSLANPATAEVESMYAKSHRNYVSSKICTYAGAGLALLGNYMVHDALIRDRKDAEVHPENHQGVGNEALGVIVPICSMIAIEGDCMLLGGVASCLAEKKLMKQLEEHNEFLLQPGMTDEMRDHYTALLSYNNSRKAMKISGITTACLGIYSLAGLSISSPDDNFFVKSSRVTTIATIAGATTFLIYWATNASDKRNLSLHPYIAPTPLENMGPVAGLSLSANF